MSISEIIREEISDRILNYLAVDGLYITSAQDRARYFRNTTNNSLSPFGTSGTHSPLEVIVDDFVRGMTDYYGVSGMTSAADQIITLIGDVYGSGTGTFTAVISNSAVSSSKILNHAVSLEKLATIQTASFMGRTSNGTGNVEVIPLTAISSYIDVSDQIQTVVDDAIAELDLTEQTIELTGDVTGSGTGTFAATIEAGVVTFPKMQPVSTDTFVGRNTAGTGDLESLSVSVVKEMLSLNEVENISITSWAGSVNLTTGGNFKATSLSASGNGTIGGDLLVSGDFFNPHVSILADGVISTDNIIYTEYLEVYNTATFDAGVNVLGNLSVGGVFATSINLYSTSALTLGDHHTVILTHATPTITLPLANSVPFGTEYHVTLYGSSLGDFSLAGSDVWLGWKDYLGFGVEGAHVTMSSVGGDVRMKSDGSTSWYYRVD